ncbi:MAG: ComEC/Rec2 family competence protein [Aureisphaera sp.]
MRFINFLILKLAACLTLGIILGHYFPTPSHIGTAIFMFLFALLLIAWLRERRKLKQGPFFGLLTFLVFIALGYLNLQKGQPHFQSGHFVHQQHTSDDQMLEVKIIEILKSDRYNHKYYAELLSRNQFAAKGKLLLTIRNDALYPKLKVDNLLLLSSKIDEIPTSLNPHQFDYRDYLHKLDVYGKITIAKGEILKIETGETTARGFSENLRSNITSKLDQVCLSTDAKAITKALVLGERRTLDKELYNNYAAAGAIHILAVSGLHVGILFLLFSWLLKPLDYFRKGKSIKAICIVLLLWGFAFLAGLSPSVVRAVTMFSCFALAKMINRPTNGFNTLALSYFILLLLQPRWLFHVGFQLSYLAVFFILWLQPNLYRLYRPRTLVDRYLWGLITVTLSAQIGVGPLSLYYFHQFPGLFLLTNMVVLPFLGVLLGLGLVTVIWSLLGNVPESMVFVYDAAIGLLNLFVQWIASQESFLFSNIAFSLPKMLIAYAFVFSLAYLWRTKNKRLVLSSLLLIALFLSIHRWEQKIHSHEELIVLHKPRTSLIAYKNNDHITLFTNDSLNPLRSYPIKGYVTENHISKNKVSAIPDIFLFKGRSIIRLDSVGIYSNKRTDIVILSESPKIHLERLIESLQPRLIIADGSNYKSYTQRWEKTCKKRQLPFHNTSEMGAYIIE